MPGRGPSAGHSTADGPEPLSWDDSLSCKRYNPRKEKRQNMKLSKLILLIAAVAGALLKPCSAAAGPWDQPAAALVARIADILGPGQARLTIQNLSSTPADEIPAIRKLLLAQLKSHGIVLAGDDSANVVRVTLSENARERLWVAEVIEGSESNVAIVGAGPLTPEATNSPGVLVLRRQALAEIDAPVLAALDVPAGLLVLEPDQVVLYGKPGEQLRASLGMVRAPGRDPRGALLASADGSTLEAWMAGVHCNGSVATDALKVTCGESDDPWAVAQPPVAAADTGNSMSDANVKVTALRAFYNAARNSFTGVVVPGIETDLSPFYSLAMLPRPSGEAVLIAGVDGKVNVAENGTLHAVVGVRDWGSDLAVLQSACGAGAQVIVSSSGDAVSDSLRAYEIQAFEAIAAGEPLEVNGSLMALSTSSDGKSVLATVRHAGKGYEVDRVTALCN